MTLDTIAKRVLDKEELDQLIADALSQNLDTADVVDEFPNNCVLTLDDDAVGVLAHEDSGIAPLLWTIAIGVLKQARQKAEAV